MKYCNICGLTATVKAVGGPVMRKAETFGHDIAYPDNYAYRCEKHKDNDAPFGKMWGWYRLKGR